MLTSQRQFQAFSQRVKIDDGHQRGPPEGSGNLSAGASRSAAAAAFAVHRQQVTVIKCFFISSQAATKGQNRIKQSGGMLALLMPRPFESGAGSQRKRDAAGQDYGTKRWRDTELSVGAVLLTLLSPHPNRF